MGRAFTWKAPKWRFISFSISMWVSFELHFPVRNSADLMLSISKATHSPPLFFIREPHEKPINYNIKGRWTHLFYKSSTFPVDLGQLIWSFNSFKIGWLLKQQLVSCSRQNTLFPHVKGKVFADLQKSMAKEVGVESTKFLRPSFLGQMASVGG